MVAAAVSNLPVGVGVKNEDDDAMPLFHPPPPRDDNNDGATLPMMEERRSSMVIVDVTAPASQECRIRIVYRIVSYSSFVHAPTKPTN